MPVLVLVRCGDAFRLLTLAMVDLLVSLALASSVACAASGDPVDAHDGAAGAPAEDESVCSICLDERHSAQSKVRVTAFFQSAYSRSTSALSMLGVHSLSLPQFSRRSSTCAQNPTASPAA